jgi:hypothetical protein
MAAVLIPHVKPSAKHTAANRIAESWVFYRFLAFYAQQDNFALHGINNRI